MASSISAGTTSSTALVATADTSGALVLQTNNGTTALTLDTSQNATFAGTLTTAAQGIAKASLPAGAVLQVVQATTDSQLTITGATYADITGLSVSITPTSTSSKILVRYRINGGTGGGTTYHAFQIVRGSTAVGNGTQGTTRTKAHSSVRGQFSDTNAYWTTSGEFLDSPATTSATTYKIQTATNGTTYVNRASGNADTADYTSTLCSITVMEIAA
jgi:hypothetical protein